VSDAAGPVTLVVEDEALVAITIEEVLLDAGFRVCGIADRPAEAMALARRHRPELAVVDVRLAAGGDGIQLAGELVALGPIGILFATGNPSEVFNRARVGQGCLSKPFEAAWLIAALRAVHGEGGPPRIPGFRPLPFPKTL